jgi:NAD(P)H-flavin reductase
MIVEELRQLNGAELALLFGSRSEADILWGAEFSALARAQRNFLFEPSLSQPSDDWRGRRGYVQQHLLELVTSLRPSEIYICGPAAMVTGCLAVLESDAVASSTRICSETQ